MIKRIPMRRTGSVLTCLGLCGLTGAASGQTQLAKLTASTPQNGIEFGGSVALDGDLAAIGTTWITLAGPAPFPRSVDLFERQADGSWGPLQVITFQATGIFEIPGRSLALEGDTLFLASSLDNTVATAAGAVYVMERGQDGLFSHTQLLTASDATMSGFFGRTVASSGDDAVITAAGSNQLPATYFFERSPGGTWSEVAKITDTGVPSDFFGWSLALDGDLALVGVPRDDDYGTDSGRVVAYEKQAGTGWAFVQEVIPANLPTGALFGSSISISGNRALIGSPHEDTSPGRAHLFEWQPPAGWVEIGTLDPSPPVPSGQFGDAVVLEGGLAVVGAPMTSLFTTLAGAAYAFREGAPNEWTQVARIGPEDPQMHQRYGTPISLSEGRALIGARYSDITPINDGTAYVHAVSASATGDVASISVQSGGTQTISIDAGPDGAGRPYLLVGSASGTSPGTPINVLNTAPLNADAYLVHTIANPNLPPLAGSFGQLDGNGVATASFTVPPATDPGLVGLAVDHACIVFGSPIPKVFVQSNPVRVLLDS